MLKLYHFWSSTCSRKVRICLAEKELDWVSHHVDIVKRQEHLEDWYIELNPSGVVPTLIHDDKILTESNVIIDYIDDCFPDNPLKPPDPFEKAIMRIWVDKAEAIVHRNINIISWNKRHMPRMAHLTEKEHLNILLKIPDLEKRMSRINRLKNGVSEADEKLATRALKAVVLSMENTLSKTPWLAGDQFSLADIAIAPFVERFEANALKELVSFKLYPNVGDWWKRVTARKSYSVAYNFENPDL